jgi:hypothetical protein
VPHARAIKQIRSSGTCTAKLVRIDKLDQANVLGRSDGLKQVTMRPTLANTLGAKKPPALLIGNGINRHNNYARSSWEDLLGKLARKRGLSFTHQQMLEMSNTEFFDILDLAKPKEDKSNLQREFCDHMASWEPADHHAIIMGWAQRHAIPIITVNFDENLSRSIGAQCFGPASGFTDYYPWRSYFSDSEINDPKSNFAIWHAHGMMRYARSIRLGLTHYMGSVQRARPLVYGKGGLRARAKSDTEPRPGPGTWLEVFFLCPLLVVGFGCGKDETFLRWLFLERARLHKLVPSWRRNTWFVAKKSSENDHRKPFFEKLGIEFVIVSDYEEIYENQMWRR